MKKIYFLFLFFVPITLLGQTHLSGLIRDNTTKKPLPFATIVTNIGVGEITDTEGKFIIDSKFEITELTISYVGYKTKKINLTKSQNFISIFLESINEDLNEVIIIAKENPAIQIIKNAIKNKSKNNIKKALNYYKYNSYNKLIVTANPDSISSKIDSVFVLKNGNKQFKRLDSTNFEFRKEIEGHHLYITEKISELKFQRGKNPKETILASRMAGFKQPIYEFLALNIENFSFYDETYELLGNNYVNPLAKNALKTYNYKILDTIHYKDRWAYMIYYKPKKVKETVGLEGLLYINSENFSIEKGIAELKGVVAIKAVQTFDYREKYNIWFPVETQISIRKGNNNQGVSFFGGTIKFSNNDIRNDSIIKTNQKDPSDISYLLSKTKNFDIEINQPVKVIKSASTIEIDENALKKSEVFWNKYRTEPLTKRGVEAYQIIDSLSKDKKVEKKLIIGRKVLKGYYPTNYIDLDLSQLINFNNYEGIRLGFGGLTNSLFSNRFKFEAYVATGLKDGTLKYHIGTSIRLNKKNRSWLGFGYTDDLQEAAKLDFLFDDTSFSLINPRNFNISQFYNYKTFNLNFQQDIFPNLEMKFKLEHGSYNPKFDYLFITKNNSYSNYNLTLGIIALQWTPFNTYMTTPNGKLIVKKGYPKITAQLTRSFDNLLDGDLSFTQLNFKLEQTIKLIGKSSTSFLIQGGYVNGDIPLSHLYNAFPNYSLKNPWKKRINFSGTNAFETMAFNEFISDKYISVQARHNFKRFVITSKFKPSLSLISRFAIGTIDNSNQHVVVSFKKMNQGYFESGLVLNHLFKGFGLSSFFRYGAYSNSAFSDNLAIKLTYVLNLGF
jgi:hypothetical protein